MTDRMRLRFQHRRSSSRPGSADAVFVAAHRAEPVARHEAVMAPV